MLGFWAHLQNCETRVLASSCPSVRQAAVWNSTPTGRILMKCDILDFFENLLRKVKFHENPTKITRTLHEDFSHL